VIKLAPIPQSLIADEILDVTNIDDKSRMAVNVILDELKSRGIPLICRTAPNNATANFFRIVEQRKLYLAHLARLHRPLNR
jgi:hypothetical protein